ncbi:DUF58 domain-containing protein [Methanococcus sp. CF]
MEKGEFLAFVSILLFLEGYFFVNILSALLGVGILSSLLILKLSFEPDFEIEVQTSSLEFTESETLDIILKIKNKSKYPLKIGCIPNNSNFTWESKSTTISPKNIGNIFISLKSKSKGSFLINEIPLKISDVFEMFEKTFEFNTSLTITVYPSNENIIKGINTNNHEKIGKEMLSSSKIGQRTLEFDYLRDYTPGDQFKHIDWKSSLKSMRLISKEFEKEIEGEISVLVDVSKNFLKDFSGGNNKTDYVSILTFQLMANIIKNGSANILFFNESGLVDIQKNIKSSESLKKCIKNKLIPRKGSPYILNSTSQFFEKTAFLNIVKSFSKNSPEKWLSIAKHIKSNSTVLIITDTYRYKELVMLNNEIIKTKSKLYIISPNPFLFGINELTEETIPTVYKSYVKREKNILKLNNLCPTIDVGPNDLADYIIGEFK